MLSSSTVMTSHSKQVANCDNEMHAHMFVILNVLNAFLDKFSMQNCSSCMLTQSMLICAGFIIRYQHGADGESEMACRSNASEICKTFLPQLSSAVSL